MTEVLKSGNIQQKVKGFFFQGWQPRQLNILDGKFEISKKDGSKKKTFNVDQAVVNVAERVGNELEITVDKAQKLYIRCKNVNEARSWMEGFKQSKKRTSGKIEDKVLTTESEKTGAIVSAASKSVSYDAKEDVAVINVIEPSSAAPEYVMLNGGYSFGVQMCGGIVKMPGSEEIIRRRETMGTKQALMLLLRDSKIMRERKRLTESRRLLLEYIELATLVYGKVCFEVVSAMQLLAEVMSDQNDHGAAQKVLQEAAEIEEKL